MELVIEIILEIYLELMVLIVPEENASKKHILIAKILAVCVSIALAAFVIWGFVLIVDYNNMWGIVPITIAIILSLAQIVAGIVLYKKHH